MTRIKFLPFFFIIATLFFTACKESTKVKNTDSSPEQKKEMETTKEKEYDIPMVEELETIHQVDQFYQREAIKFDVALVWGGKERLNARITSKTNSTKVRLDSKDGMTLLYDGEKVLQQPIDKDYPKARFDMFTWQYFFMAPFKFTDPGTNWESLEDGKSGGKTYTRGKLTFDAGTGDAPDDWYIAYQDKETEMLAGLAYIVTYYGPKEDAEENPHAITYHNYQRINGVPIATNWKFWNWSDEEGMFEQLGEAEITNIEFLNPTEETFVMEGERKEISL